MKDFLSLCQNRRSVHDFLPDVRISDEEFTAIMEAVRLSPSGYNAQPWHFVLVRKPERVAHIQSIAFDQAHLTTAGNIVIVCADKHFAETDFDRLLAEGKLRNMSKVQLADLANTLKKERSDEQLTLRAIRNGAIGAATFLYAAAAKGWATCPMMGFSQRRVIAYINAPERFVPVLMIALGKEDTAKTPPRLPRKEIAEISSYESF